MSLPRTAYQQLEHEMSCAVETGNPPEVALVVAQAESAYEAKQISALELANLVWDSIRFKEDVC